MRSAGGRSRLRRAAGRPCLGRGAGAVVLAGADRALLLDVPVLAEAVEAGGDQDELEQGEDHHQQADQRDRDQRVFEAGLVAGEPAVGADRAEDRQDHRERGGDGQDAAAPARDEEAEEGVEQGEDQADGAHPAAAAEQREAADRDQRGDRRRGQHQEGDHELGRDHVGLLPIRVPELVARRHLSYRHAVDHRIYERRSGIGRALSAAEARTRAWRNWYTRQV